MVSRGPTLFLLMTIWFLIYLMMLVVLLGRVKLSIKKIETLVCIRCRLKRRTGSKTRSWLPYQQTKQHCGRVCTSSGRQRPLHPYGRVVGGGNCVRIESRAALESWITKGREMERRRSEEPGLYRPPNEIWTLGTWRTDILDLASGTEKDSSVYLHGSRADWSLYKLFTHTWATNLHRSIEVELILTSSTKWPATSFQFIFIHRNLIWQFSRVSLNCKDFVAWEWMQL